MPPLWAEGALWIQAGEPAAASAGILTFAVAGAFACSGAVVWAAGAADPVQDGCGPAVSLLQAVADKGRPVCSFVQETYSGLQHFALKRKELTPP